MNPSVVQHIHRLISLSATVQYILILLQKNLPLINRTARLMVPPEPGILSQQEPRGAIRCFSFLQSFWFVALY